MQRYGVTFDLGSARMFSALTFETKFGYYMHFYLIFLSPLTAIIQLIYQLFYSFHWFSSQSIYVVLNVDNC